MLQASRATSSPLSSPGPSLISSPASSRASSPVSSRAASPHDFGRGLRDLPTIPEMNELRASPELEAHLYSGNYTCNTSMCMRMHVCMHVQHPSPAQRHLHCIVHGCPLRAAPATQALCPVRVSCLPARAPGACRRQARGGGGAGAGGAGGAGGPASADDTRGGCEPAQATADEPETAQGARGGDGRSGAARLRPRRAAPQQCWE